MKRERLDLWVSGQLLSEGLGLPDTKGVSAPEYLYTGYSLLIFFGEGHAVLWGVLHVGKKFEIPHKQLVDEVVLPNDSVESTDELRGLVLVAVETGEQLLDELFVLFRLQQSLEVHPHNVSESPHLFPEEDHLRFRLGQAENLPKLVAFFVRLVQVDVEVRQEFDENLSLLVASSIQSRPPLEKFGGQLDFLAHHECRLTLHLGRLLHLARLDVFAETEPVFTQLTQRGFDL